MSKGPTPIANRMAKDDPKAYTMKNALKDASELLAAQFGEAEQHATVVLATFLYGAHERELFMKSRPEADGTAYGAPAPR